MAGVAWPTVMRPVPVAILTQSRVDVFIEFMQIQCEFLQGKLGVGECVGRHFYEKCYSTFLASSRHEYSDMIS